MYNDDFCWCPFESEFVDCTQPEVDKCGNSGLDGVHAQRIQQRDEICARAGDVPSIPVPPAFCNDGDGPNSEACLDNECIACYEPLFHATCSGDHYPAECCDSISRHVQCLTDCSLVFGTSRTNVLSAQTLGKTYEDFCGEGCPINWEGLNNDLLCSCFIEYKTNSRDCKYIDDFCRCPFEGEFVDCTQPEVDACGSSGLDAVHAQRIRQRDEICAHANELVPAPTTQAPTSAPSVPGTRAPIFETPTMPVPIDPITNAPFSQSTTYSTYEQMTKVPMCI